MDEALETLCLILYSVMTTYVPGEIHSDPKLEHTVHLLFDVLSTTLFKVDPWFIE